MQEDWLKENTETLIKEKIKREVGVIPWFIRYIPGFTKISGFPLKDRFLLSPDLYKDLLSEHPSHYVIGLVLHELEHIKRARGFGFWKYHILYRLNKNFRYKEELECHKPQFKYYKQVGYKFDLEYRARILSSSLYFWPVKYKKAFEDLSQIFIDV